MTNNLRFPGQYFDEETGTHYNYFRDYEPGTGRYLESDPIGLLGGLNSYGYVNSRPYAMIDPLGLVEYSGSVTGFTVGYIGLHTYNLVSECVDGMRAIISVRFTGVGYGWGLNLSATNSAVSFTDSLDDIVPSVFNGDWGDSFSAGGAVTNPAGHSTYTGVVIAGQTPPSSKNVYGCSVVKLGNAGTRGLKCGSGTGLDYSIGALIGESNVSSVRYESCKSSCSNVPSQKIPDEKILFPNDRALP